MTTAIILCVIFCGHHSLSVGSFACSWLLIGNLHPGQGKRLKLSLLRVTEALCCGISFGPWLSSPLWSDIMLASGRLELPKPTAKWISFQFLAFIWNVLQKCPADGCPLKVVCFLPAHTPSNPTPETQMLYWHTFDKPLLSPAVSVDADSGSCSWAARL